MLNSRLLNDPPSLFFFGLLSVLGILQFYSAWSSPLFTPFTGICSEMVCVAFGVLFTHDAFISRSFIHLVAAATKSSVVTLLHACLNCCKYCIAFATAEVYFLPAYAASPRDFAPSWSFITHRLL